MSKLTVVLCEPRDDDPLRRRLAEQLLAGWAGRADLRVSVVGPLYDLPADGPGAAHLRSLSGDLAVLGWLHPRAARWVLDALGVEGRAGDSDETDSPAGRTIWCFDLRGQEEPEAYLREIDRIARLGDRRRPAVLCGAGVSPAKRDAGETPARRRDACTTIAGRPGRAVSRGGSDHDAVVSGDRSRAVRQLPGVFELLPVRRLRIGRLGDDSRRAARRLSPRLPRVRPDLPRQRDHVPSPRRRDHRGRSVEHRWWRADRHFAAFRRHHPKSTSRRPARPRGACASPPEHTDLDGLVDELDELDL